jgi:hypothetical protein
MRRTFKKSPGKKNLSAPPSWYFARKKLGRSISMPNPATKTPQTLGRTAAEANIEEEIRIRAYELFEARGRGDGHDVEDWLEAEADITDRTKRAQAA